jgi:iron complex outermembrane receptor protein
MTSKSCNAFLGTLGAGWLVAALAVPVSNASASEADDQPEQIQEIIVTAQKRNERLLDVPISVAALTNSQLVSMGVNSTKDLEFVIPSFVTNELAGWSQTFLRGVGTDIQNPGAEPGVATYVDGVYSPFIIAPINGLLGVERTEVLYGPQGTLYGRNAVGGAVNIVTRTPTHEFEAGGALTFGNFARKELSGYVSGGLSDKVSASVAVAGTDRHSYYSFLGARPPNTPQHEDNAGVRLKVVGTPTDTLTLTGTLEYQRTTGLEAAAFRQLVPYATGYAVGAPRRIEYNVLDANYPINQAADEYRGVLQINKGFSWADLVSVTAYQGAYQEESIDVDGTSAKLVAARPINPKLTDISQELRLQSTSSSNIQWVGGLYYSHSVIGFSPDITILQDVITVPNIDSLTYQRQHTTSAAVFGQVTFPIMEKLRVTLGGRYSHDHKLYDSAQTSTILDGTNTVLANQFYPNDTHSWSAFTPKVTLSYKFTPDVLGYATFSEGYKSGQYQAANPQAPGPVGPEKLYDIEGGLKAELLDHRLSVNISGFHYDYKELQVYSTVLLNNQFTSFLGNNARAKIYGGDLSLNAVLPKGFTAGAALAFNHGTYTSFPAYSASVPSVAGSASASVDATGNPVQRLPNRTISANAQYKRAFADGSAITASGLWSYNSGFSWDPSNIYRQKAYDVTNARLEYTLPGTNISVAGWCNNLFNRQYEKIEFAYSLGLFGVDAAPRMYGVTVSYKH